MAAITEEKLGKYLGKAFKEVILPALHDMDKKLNVIQTNMTTKDDLKVGLSDLDNKVNTGFESVNKRIDNIGKTLAVPDEDAPTREEFDKLGVRIKKIEVKVASI